MTCCASASKSRRFFASFWRNIHQAVSTKDKREVKSVSGYGPVDGTMKDMARGWESKSVEDQVAEKESASNNAASAAKEAVTKANRQRERQALELQKERILDQRTSNPHRRAALEAALADIEARLSGLQ
jgi:hypothetical protein